MQVPVKWQSRFMEMAFLNASWSKDPSTKVGAVITEGNRIISQGFNGYPQGVTDSPNDAREVKYLKVIHAEENAILHARRDLTGCSLFATHFPCPNCTAKIIQVGITTIFVPEMDRDYYSRWEDKIDVSIKMLKETGVEVFSVQGFSERFHKPTQTKQDACCDNH